MGRVVKHNYKKIGKEEINKKFEEAWAILSGAGENINVWTGWVDEDRTQAVIGMIAPSQEALDKYKATTREKAMAVAADMMAEKNPIAFEEVGPIYGPDAFP